MIMFFGIFTELSGSLVLSSIWWVDKFNEFEAFSRSETSGNVVVDSADDWDISRYKNNTKDMQHFVKIVYAMVLADCMNYRCASVLGRRLNANWSSELYLYTFKTRVREDD